MVETAPNVDVRTEFFLKHTSHSFHEWKSTESENIHSKYSFSTQNNPFCGAEERCDLAGSVLP